MMSAAASVGLSCLWDVEEGLGKIDKYTYSSEEYIKVCFVHSFLSLTRPHLVSRLSYHDDDIFVWMVIGRCTHGDRNLTREREI